VESDFHHNLICSGMPIRRMRKRKSPGPNNPVGVVWVDINKEHFVHGTPEPRRSVAPSRTAVSA
jgi:lipoprotein-anchoring transpeptidase ErfK/SrfK